MKPTIILPAYNEANYLPKLLKELKNSKYPFVIIDDGSSDSTTTIARRYTPHVLRHRINLGKGAALRTGCEYAFHHLNAEAVIFMDSDDQHSVAEVAHFHQALKEGHQMILGVRAFDSSMPLFRIMGNRLSSFLVLLLFGRYIPDIPSGYKAMTKSMYQRLKLSATGYNIELEIAVKLARARLPFHTIPITTIYHDLERGFHPLDGLSMLLDLLKWRLQI